jgi:HD-GYP domain-containing protein (c-di-GMP phosphodiesterase class II)
VPDSVLTKPGPLTAREHDAVRQHPLWGGSILRHADHLIDLLPVILHHHERYDGGGYPEGLAGERIPLMARIIAIADAYDAMTSDRSYRHRMSLDEGLQRIREGAGTQFDPHLAVLFCTLRRRRLSQGADGMPRAA